jgi:pimeloyl-ACP methyl ester carboxylesterase
MALMATARPPGTRTPDKRGGQNEQPAEDRHEQLSPEFDPGAPDQVDCGPKGRVRAVGEHPDRCDRQHALYLHTCRPRLLRHNERHAVLLTSAVSESHPRTASLSWGDREPVGTLVLLHAFPLGARMWEPQHALADQGWRIVMPQFRGFDCTKSDVPEAASIEDYARDVADLLETLAVDQAVVGGQSMGGYVAFELYRRMPHMFSGLVLADTRAEPDTPEGRANRARMIELAGARGAVAIADEMVPKLLGDTTRRSCPAVEDRVRALILANHPSAIQRRFAR